MNFIKLLKPKIIFNDISTLLHVIIKSKFEKKLEIYKVVKEGENCFVPMGIIAKGKITEKCYNDKGLVKSLA